MRLRFEGFEGILSDFTSSRIDFGFCASFCEDILARFFAFWSGPILTRVFFQS
jgi:hypothetical protein